MYKLRGSFYRILPKDQHWRLIYIAELQSFFLACDSSHGS